VVVDPTDLGTGSSCPGTPETSQAAPWTGWHFNTASTVFAPDAAFAGTVGTLTRGGGGSPTVSGTDTTPGCTFDGTGGAVTLATATNTGNANEGGWDMTGTTVDINITGKAPAGSGYAAQLQYTVTG